MDHLRKWLSLAGTTNLTKSWISGKPCERLEHAGHGDDEGENPN